MIVPKIVWPSGGANELLFAFPPVGVRPFDRAGRRHDTIASSGKRQSLLERTDKFLELDLTLVPTEAESYALQSQKFDNAAWTKNQCTVTGVDTIVDPFDGQEAERITPDGASTDCFVFQDAFSRVPDTSKGLMFVGSVWLKTASGIQDFRIFAGERTGVSSFKDLTLTTNWQRVFVFRVFDATAATQVRFQLGGVGKWKDGDPAIDFFGGMIAYGSSPGPYVETEGAIPAAIDRWDTFITAVMDGTNFDYYPDAFAAGFTTYVLEDKAWRPKLQVRGANRFYEFKLRLREFV